MNYINRFPRQRMNTTIHCLTGTSSHHCSMGTSSHHCSMGTSIQHCKNVILCPGQSSQYIGMMSKVGKSLKIEEMIKTANKILGYDIVKICQHGPDEVLSRTIHCQPAVVIASLVAFEMLKENMKESTGHEFDVGSVAGYSVGEISALYMSGVLDYEEAILLLKGRAIAMDYASSLLPSGMLVMQGLSFEQTRQVCDDMNNIKDDSSHRVSIAIEQYPNAVSLGGSLCMLNNVMNREHTMLKDINKVKLAMVNVSGAFHTEYMLPAQEKLNNILQKLNLKKIKIDIYCNVTGLKYDQENQDIPDLLVRQVVEPVLWNSIMEDIKQESKGSNLKLYEVGPGKQLKAIVSKIDRKLVRCTENVSL